MGASWPHWRRLVGAIPLLLTVGLVGCSAAVPQSVFDPKGPVAREQLRLLNLTMWLAIGVFALVSALFVYAVVRFRARPDARPPKQIHGHHTLEIIWTLIPILILAVIAVPTVQAAFTLAVPPGAAPLQVRAVGYQWWWAFTYPAEGFETANELRIPVGKPVALELESKDVIHSLWVPRLAGKVDVVPGRINTMWLQADEPGVYYGQCAEFCGASHANMRFRVVALTQAEFDAWVRARQAGLAPKQPPADAVAAKGHTLFEQKGCIACHAIDGTKYQGKVAPNLTDLNNRGTIAAGLLKNDDEHLKEWLSNPQAVKPGAKMPNLGLQPEEIQALTAYLRTLK